MLNNNLQKTSFYQLIVNFDKIKIFFMINFPFLSYETVNKINESRNRKKKFNQS